MVKAKPTTTTPEQQATCAEIALATETALATASGTAVATLDEELLLEDGDAETGFKKEDLAIPFLRVAQKGTPFANKRDPEYIDGWEPGDLYNTVSKKKWASQDGVIIAPITFQHSYIEWIPRTKGGGFVHNYGEDGSILDKTTKSEDGRNILPDSGNEVVASGLYYVMQINADGTCEPMVFVLTGSQWKKVRTWNTVMSTVTARDKSGKPFRPAKFYMSYKVTTVFEKNDKGDWMGVNIALAKPVLELNNGTDIYMACREFKKVVAEGGVQIAPEEAAGGSGSGSEEEVPF